MDNSNSLEIETISTGPNNEEQPNRYLKGFRLVVAVLGLGIAVFLPTAEASIVSTSLVTISKDLNGYNQSSWIITSYLLTYMGFLVVWSKLTDVLGLRPVLLSSTIIFMAFSAGCGTAQSITQLIIFRAFQGIGGSVLYSVPTIGMFQLVPASWYDKMNSISASFMAISLLLGPVIGGAISQTGNWRWIFYMTLPAGAISLALTFTVLPSRFPRHCDPPPENNIYLSGYLTFFSKIDALGALLLLSASILLVTVLEEGGVQLAWRSGVIIAFFILSGLFWVVFIWWQWFASREASDVDPMFPRRFFGNRIFLGTLLSFFIGCFISGIPLIVAVIELPQRYQIVNAASPLKSGVQLLAYAATLPLGIVFSNTLTGKFRVPFVYPLLFGAALQTIGFALMSILPTGLETWSGQYGYNVVAGLGMGITVGIFYVMSPIAVDKKDQHLAVGAVLQARLLGSAVGIAIMNNILNHYISEHLVSVLPYSQLDDLLQSAANLGHYPPDVQTKIRALYGEAFNLQMRATAAFCAAQFLIVAVIWNKQPLRLSKDGTLVR